MQIPETPLVVADLDLMKRLKSYADGTASWLEGWAPVGQEAKTNCGILHSNVTQFTALIGQLLDKINAREMETFTMHDRKHALKVAHLMWHILSEDRRNRLRPPEIALLVCSAFFHDVGMFLSPAIRETRLDPTSDLWQRLELDPDVSEKLSELRAESEKEAAGAKKDRIARRIVQAEEALLCQDTRERHATKERYQEILDELRALHKGDAAKIVDVDSCLSHCGDTFLEKLVDICVSHNESSVDLVRRDSRNSALPRFQKQYPVGENADLLLIASALRLADILDFDRERTPAVIYYYLLPTSLEPGDDRPTLEWSKHLSISNWEIGGDSIVFRGRCRSHIVHHAIVNFCGAIGAEIAGTHTAWRPSSADPWPFRLPNRVEHEITAEGYVYVPYEFTIDDERIYRLLMGGAIYENSLDAVRELVQNAVDACKLRDALTHLYEPELLPSSAGRIFVEYSEPDESSAYPRLCVTDTGTGMDELAIDQWFLRVGRSYYSSLEFNRYRVLFREKGIDFAPVSEFGIGFLACFLLADRVTVETAMWRPMRGDSKKRTLEIDGPTRLIRLREEANAGPAPFRGTKVTLVMVRGSGKDASRPPAWEELTNYLRGVCLSLPYRIELRHIARDAEEQLGIDPLPARIELPSELEGHAVRIPVKDEQSSLEGEIVLLNASVMEQENQRRVEAAPFEVAPERREATARPTFRWRNDLSAVYMRGGFFAGDVSPLPGTYRAPVVSYARMGLGWEQSRARRFALPNLSRSGLTSLHALRPHVFRIWCSWLLRNRAQLPMGFLRKVTMESGIYSIPLLIRTSPWIEEHSALELFELASKGYNSYHGRDGELESWSNGEIERLPLSPDLYFCDALLDVVLPYVTERVYERVFGMHALAPNPGWQDVLASVFTFVSQPRPWGPFARYADTQPERLYEQGAGAINAAFKDRIEALFLETEITDLLSALHRVARAGTPAAPTKLTPREYSALQKLQVNPEFSQLTIGAGGFEPEIKVGSLRLPPMGD